jgi:hypothetical protein
MGLSPETISGLALMCSRVVRRASVAIAQHAVWTDPLGTLAG